ncbi:saccharopine dehydrogenase NADP-binding domain-containing protein [Flavobacteriaceae bacterium]|nr:saccharopine dehydrogenase NADP-binding domain-containing protein [Flavobacteriaceae bacterium]MDC1492769.1 saccharopine dehydrogenase NADP-binding domain-containing protein [Flavobacteriaceae bacterium]
MNKKYDIVVWGASGFTGRLVCEYIFKNYTTKGSDLRWAMGGRNKVKLKKIREKIADNTIPILIADSNNMVSLNELTKSTKVVCTTVGPYAKYGSKLVESCIENNSHYCDLAGEVQWMHEIINKHHESAKKNKVKIVHTCGFDSIPSDMGVYFINKELNKNNQNAKSIDMRVAGIKGGISGGTYASLSNVIEDSYKDKNIYKILSNPYSLNPKGLQSGEDKKDLMKIVFDKISKNWIGPFVMATINTKVVRRSNALSNFSYGTKFRYSEATLAGKGIKGKIKGYLSAIPLIFVGARPNSILKKIANAILPSPGQGPSKNQREDGYYNLKFYIKTEDNTEKIARVIGDMDPGYGSTSKMLAESAICLAKDNLPEKSGVLTPSTSMGDFLLKRLQDKAGLTFTFE